MAARFSSYHALVRRKLNFCRCVCQPASMRLAGSCVGLKLGRASNRFASDFRFGRAALAIISGSLVTVSSLLLQSSVPTHAEEKEKPVLILLSGKRGVGKDYTLKLLQQEAACMESDRVAFADATKIEFAAFAGLDATRLANDREYKELHRAEMTSWYKQKVAEDPSYFIKIAAGKVARLAANKDFIAVSDWRFLEELGPMERIAQTYCSRIVKVRIEAKEESRARFGWQAAIVDQSATETSLDNYKGFEVVIHNDGNTEDLIQAIRRQLIPVAFPSSILSGLRCERGEHNGDLRIRPKERPSKL